jgi:hypothetical protein
MSNDKQGKIRIFTRYITRKGKRIYKKNGGVFVFYVDPK